MKESKREHGDYFDDMLYAAGKALNFVQGMGYEEFKEDEKTIFAVVRALEVIGEAARNISHAIRKHHPEIPWEDIIGMRNIVVHEYFSVDTEVVWKTLQQDLPDFVKVVSKIIKECN